MSRKLLAIALLAAAALPLAAQARSSVVLGFHFGIPIYGPPAYYYPPYYYPPPYYYYPAPVYSAPVYSAPPAAAPAPAAPSTPTWYYCESSRAYYPYVRECPGGWQQVPASPPPAR